MAYSGNGWNRDDFNFDELMERIRKEDKERTKLPEPIDYQGFKNAQIQKPAALVENFLDASSRLVIGGSSKTYKTWLMSDLALSIASANPWWDHTCHEAPVLYINFELKDYYLRERLLAIQNAKEITESLQNFFVWNLRDHNVAAQLNDFKEQLLEFIALHGIAVAFFDPFYKLLGEADERVSAQLIPILAIFEQVARQTNCSTVTSAHYSKGSQACKDPEDRISGGAAINRHPDTLLLLTKHKTNGSFTVDIISRDFAPVDPFVVTWHHPLLLKNDSLDPGDLKKPMPLGRPKSHTQNDLLKILKEHDDELSSSEFQILATEETGMSRTVFYEFLANLSKQELIFKSKVSRKWNLKL